MTPTGSQTVSAVTSRNSSASSATSLSGREQVGGGEKAIGINYLQEEQSDG